MVVNHFRGDFFDLPNLFEILVEITIDENLFQIVILLEYQFLDGLFLEEVVQNDDAYNIYEPLMMVFLNSNTRFLLAMLTYPPEATDNKAEVTRVHLV